MALKRKLESLDGLSDDVKALYKQEGNVFVLDLDGDDNNADALQKKIDDLLTEKKAAQAKQKQAEDDAAEAAEVARKAKESKAEKDKDFESLANSYKEKIDTLETQIGNMRTEAVNERIGSQAMKIATEVGAEGTNVELLSRFVKDRLKADDEGNIKVTDKDGNLVMNTFDDLVKEFKGGAEWAPFITGSKGSGSGAGGEKSGGGAPKKLSEMGDQERKELHESNPEEFSRLVSESRNANAA